MKATAYVDGACNNATDKRGGFGALLTLETGEQIEIYGCLGLGVTSNIAEYAALIAALEQASKEGVTELIINADSMLVVMQMRGKWRVKHPNMRESYAVAREWARKIRRVTYNWIPREMNGEADDLSRCGIGAKPFAGPTVHRRVTGEQ